MARLAPLGCFLTASVAHWRALSIETMARKLVNDEDRRTTPTSGPLIAIGVAVLAMIVVAYMGATILRTVSF